MHKLENLCTCAQVSRNTI